MHQWPVERYLHAAVMIMTDSPVLLISGGVEGNNQALADCWIFKVTQHYWIKVYVSNSINSLAYFKLKMS